MAPSAVGKCRGGEPFFSAAVISSGFIGGSVPAKLTVPAVSSEMPCPEPTPW